MGAVVASVAKQTVEQIADRLLHLTSSQGRQNSNLTSVYSLQNTPISKNYEHHLTFCFHSFFYPT